MEFRTEYVCTVCGWVQPRKLATCPACKTEGSLEQAGLRPLSDVSADVAERLTTRIEGLDFVLGGGIVPGSVVLLGGAPGLGKSTLLTQMAINVAHDGDVVAYISAEESLGQMRLRADRLAVSLPNTLLVNAENDLKRMLADFDRVGPGLVIVDSIQSISHPQIRSSAGAPAQIRGCTERLLAWAKRGRAPVFVVGHVTKSGGVAGPKTLEHMVDAVLYLEQSKRFPKQRRLYASKNRFGAINIEAFFAMLPHGLYEPGRGMT